jgi:CheY-specific phosphatase CheX/anti-anti-sigma regulatory factor
MKPVVRKKIATFYPQGFIDTNNAYYIMGDKDVNKLINNDNIRMVLVSLKRVVFFNINGINILMDNMKKVKDARSAIVIGFCDYNIMQYETIRRFYEKNLFFSLYKTFRIATLFTTPSVGNESILVWNENYEQRNLQGIELFEMGYNPVVAHRKKDFIDHLKRENAYEEIVEDTYIGSVGIVPFARVSGSAVIYTLQGYLDATIEQQFDYIYHNKAIRTGFKLFIFDMKNIVSMNVKVLDFFERLVKDTTQIGGTICIVNLEEISSLRKIREELEEMNIQLFKNLEEILNNKELMIELGGVVKDDKEHHKALTKNLINHLPSFINATVTTLEMMVAIKAVKADRIKIKELELKDKKQKIASSIGFYGDLEGIIILVFPIELAKKSCSTMIGEEITSMGEVLDSLAEFVNIIAGRVKTYLEDQKIGVSITLPRTYASIDELFETLTMHKGVQVDLNFNQETFTFFLTR